MCCTNVSSACTVHTVNEQVVHYHPYQLAPSQPQPPSHSAFYHRAASPHWLSRPSVQPHQILSLTNIPQYCALFLSKKWTFTQKFKLRLHLLLCPKDQLHQVRQFSVLLRYVDSSIAFLSNSFISREWNPEYITSPYDLRMSSRTVFTRIKSR